MIPDPRKTSIYSPYSEAPVAEAALPKPKPAFSYTWETMLKQIRSWAIWCLILGALHLLTNGFLSGTWGIMLIAVSLASFYFRTAAMFVIYGITIGWAGLSNLLGGQPGWIVFALLQAYWAYTNFRSFGKYKALEDGYRQEQEQAPAPAIETDETPGPAGYQIETKYYHRAEKAFPWLSFFLGAVGIVSFLGVVGIIIVAAAMAQGTAIPVGASAALDVIMSLSLIVSLLAFSSGLAALLARYRKMALSILGMAAGGVVLLLNLALIFLARSN